MRRTGQLTNPQDRRRSWWVPCVGFCLLLAGCSASSASSDRNTGGSQQAVELAEEWVNAVLDGEFETARQLTYGEAGEPESLNGLARTLFAYQTEYGQPVIRVGEATISTRGEVVCMRFDYGDFAIDGGMVLRDWPDQGLRLWEYRSGDSACVDADAAATTTLPEVPPLP